MIPGSTNGQVWVAKDIKKIEPCGRTSKIYPVEVTEGISPVGSISRIRLWTPYNNLEVFADAMSIASNVASIRLVELTVIATDALNILGDVTQIKLLDLNVTAVDAVAVSADVAHLGYSAFLITTEDALTVTSDVTSIILV